MRCSRSTSAARACFGLLRCGRRNSGSGSCRPRRLRPRTADRGPRASATDWRAPARSAPARARAPPRRGCARRTASSDRTTAAAMAAHKIGGATSGANATPKFNSRLLLPQPLEQRRHMHLVGLVVAGERVHDDVDAGAEREFALARLAFDHRQHRLAVRLRRPGAGKIVRSNENGGHAVAAARRPACRCSCSFSGGSASTQSWPVSKRPGKSRSR